MFVITLGMDNFDCTKMNAHFKKFTACLREGLIHEWKQALGHTKLILCFTDPAGSFFLKIETKKRKNAINMYT